MRIATEVSEEKLRGGFYTPDRLVVACLERIAGLSNGFPPKSMLEPSVGDGAFIRGLANHRLSASLEQFVGVEISPIEAMKARSNSDLLDIDASIFTANAIEWCAGTDHLFDSAVGNPPFVRYQFASPNDIAAISLLGQRMGVTFHGVSNLWIPVFLGSLSRVRSGGSMAFVVPSELFTGVSAGVARSWLLANFDQLRIDTFEPGSFPNVLQEVIIVSGVRSDILDEGESRKLTLFEHYHQDVHRTWNHELVVGPQSWTQCLITPTQMSCLEQVKRLSSFKALGEVARLEVSIVTGANSYFSVTREEADKYELWPWAKPLLPRIRHSPGLIHTMEDQEAIAASGAKAWILDFSSILADPLSTQGAAAYLEFGQEQKLHQRYKTSIRKPWYRVPSIWSGRLLLSKRSHWFPRLVLNEAPALTTDTIYRGNMRPEYEGREADLVATFHNSLTILTAELEGRSFGGGVLELVPSEIARLIVPFPTDASEHLYYLDQLARNGGEKQSNPEALIDETDAMLVKAMPELNANDMDQIRSARKALLKRRLDRN